MGFGHQEVRRLPIDYSEGVADNLDARLAATKAKRMGEAVMSIIKHLDPPSERREIPAIAKERKVVV